MNIERLGILISFVTVFPSETDNEKRTHTYPFLACEILHESTMIHDKIIESPELTARLFSFLDENFVNSTLAGYFSRVVHSLICRNPEKLIIYLSQSGTMARLIHHSYSKSISDIVLKIITYDTQQPDFFVPERKALLQQVILSLHSPSEYNVFYAEYIITGVLYKASEINSWKDLLGLVALKENFLMYFSFFTSTDTFRVLAGANIVKTLIGMNRNELVGSYEEIGVVELLVNSLPDVKLAIGTAPNYNFVGTFREEIEPLGEHRLKLLELVNTAIKMDVEMLNESIADSLILTEVTKLFFKMPWNSILQNTVENLVTTCVLSRNASLIMSMLVTSDFIKHMISTAFSPQAVHRLGNLGHINKIGNYLNHSENEIVKNMLSQVERWEEFCNSYLENRNSLDSKILGDPTLEDQSSSSESEESETELCLPTNKQFLNYGKEKKIEIHNNTEEEHKKDLCAENFKSTSEFLIATDAKLVDMVGKKPEIEPKKFSISPRNKIFSPKNQGHHVFNLSPELHPDYHHDNYWKIGIKVDEIEDLDEL